MADAGKYSLKMEGEGISVSKDVDAETARRILNLLLGGPGIIPRPMSERVLSGDTPVESRKERPESASTKAKTASVSLREYLDEVQAKRNPDKILAIASYILDVAGAEDFGPSDIKAYFAKAGEKMPANYGRDFRWVIGHGWIAEHHQMPDRFYITNTGRKALGEKFPKELAKPQQKGSKKKKSANGNDSN